MGTESLDSFVISASLGISELELLLAELSDIWEILLPVSSWIIGIRLSPSELPDERKLPGLDLHFLGGRAGGISRLGPA